MYVYQEGSRVRINRPSDETWNGKTGVVVSRSETAETYRIQIDDSQSFFWFAESQLVPADLTNVTSQEPPSPDEVIAVLTDDLYELSKQYDLQKERCNSLATGIDKAMAIIGERLIQEAEERGWCSEFDDIIEEVNQELATATGNSRFQLPTRQIEKTVVLHRRRIVTEEITVTVTVNASDDEYRISEVAEEEAEYCDWDEIDEYVDETWTNRIYS